MSDPAEPFLDALEATLRASGPLATAMGLSEPRIYAERPTDGQLPYIQIGDDQVIGEDNGCADESEIFTTLHVYARTDAALKGSRRARRIAGVLRALLKDGFDIDGHRAVVSAFQDHRVLTDPKGSTHVVMTFRYETTPVVVESEA
jgi:hypothetical protein